MFMIEQGSLVGNWAPYVVDDGPFEETIVYATLEEAVYQLIEYDNFSAYCRRIVDEFNNPVLYGRHLLLLSYAVMDSGENSPSMVKQPSNMA